LRVLRADSSNSSVSLEFGKWSGNQTKTYTAAFGIVNEEMFPVQINDVSVVMHDGAADYMQIWLHAHEDMYVADEAVGDRVFMWDQGVDPNDDTWILGAGNQDSSDASFGLTPWDSDSRVRYGSDTNSVGAIQGVNDFVWVQISLVVPGGAFAGSIAGSIVFDFSTDILNESDVKKIFTIEDLDAMRYDVSADYVLMNDLDFFNDSHYDNAALNKSRYITGNGWAPIGTSTTPFAGSFNGDGFTISNLFINRPTTQDIGLFGVTNDSDVTNVGLVDVDIIGGGTDPNVFHTGSLVGLAKESTLINVYATGTIQAAAVVGGLVGYQYLSTIQQSYSKADITCSATGLGSFLGGLVGVSYNSIIEDMYATGNLTGVGGRSPSRVGGLIGHLVRDSTGPGYAGKYTKNCYAVGKVTGNAGRVGGIVGLMFNPTFIGCYWDTQTSGQSTAVGATGSVGSSAGTYGRTTAQMYQQSTYVGWDFEDIWFINQGVDYPRLRTI
jgi:hypothetical protein